MDRTRIKLAVGAVIVLAALGYLFMSGMQASQVYYLTVSEYHQQSDSLVPGDPFRISGRVLPASVVKAANGLDLSFTVYDPAVEDSHLQVSYHGVVPDTFMENSEVVVEGSMKAEEFRAHTLLAKCPSKYEAMAEQEAQREAEEAASRSLLAPPKS